VRRQRRFPETLDARRGHDIAAPASEFGEEQRPDVARAIEVLDAQQREAVLLKYGEGLEYKDMARITGASESALKMRVKRGLDALRRALRAAGMDSNE
jgi:RNA polymerase sigma-70 factor (ECF subfamily)